MRKNRSYIRKILAEPIIKKRQDKINEKIKHDFDLKNNGLTIQSMSKRLTSNNKDNMNTSTMKMMIDNDNNNDDNNNNVDNNDDDDDEDDSVEDNNDNCEEFVKGENIAKIPRTTGSRLTSIAVSKAKYTGSKARHNPNKPLVWFK